MKIKEMAARERPREKLMEKGAAALDTSELIAILLRSGSGSRNAVEIARELLCSAGNRLSVLSAMSVDKMTEIPGIGRDKATSICSAMELGRRYLSEQSENDFETVRESGQIFRKMRPLLMDLDHEECWTVFLNRANYIVSIDKISSGGMASTVMDAKIVIRKALEKKAHGLILVHNHPSGNPRPGESDIRQTGMLKKAAELFGISLLDHIIIANGIYYSFADEGTGW